MSRARALVAMAFLPACVVASPVSAQEAGGLGAAIAHEATAKVLWQNPSQILFAIEALMDRGMIASTRSLGVPGQATALDLMALKDGKVLWTAQLPSGVDAMNVCADTLVVAISGAVQGLSLKDGSLLWEQPLQGRLETGWEPSPAFAQASWFAEKAMKAQGIGGAFFDGGGKLYTCVSGIAYRLDPATGDVVWERPIGFSIHSPLITYKDMLIVPSDKGLLALDQETGQPRWGNPLGWIGQVRVVDDCIYGVPHMQGLCRFDPETGDVLWQLEKLAPSPGDTLFHCGDRTVVISNRTPMIIHTETGELLWSVDAGGRWADTDGQNIYYSPNGTKQIHAMSIADLKEKWVAEFTGFFFSRISSVKPAVMGLGWGEVEAFNADTGAAIWSWKAPMIGGTINDVTMTADDRAYYIQTKDGIIGFDVATGMPVLEYPGEFFFCHWMSQRNGTLYFHVSPPTNGYVAAIPLTGAQAAQ